MSGAVKMKEAVLSVLSAGPLSMRQAARESGVSPFTVNTTLRREWERGTVLASEPVLVLDAGGRYRKTVFYLAREGVGARRLFMLKVFDPQLGREVETEVRFYSREEADRKPVSFEFRLTKEMVYNAIAEFCKVHGKGIIRDDLRKILGRTSDAHIIHLVEEGKLIKYGKKSRLGAHKPMPRVGFIYAPVVENDVEGAMKICERRLIELFPRIMPLTSRVKQVIDSESGGEIKRWTNMSMFQNSHENPLGIELTPQQASNVLSYILRDYPDQYEEKRIGNLVLVRNRKLMPEELAESLLGRYKSEVSDYNRKRLYWAQLIEIIPQEAFIQAMNPAQKRFAVKNYDVFTHLFIPNNPFVLELDLVGVVEYIPEFCEPRNWTHFVPISCKAVTKGANESMVMEFFNQLRYHTENNAIRLPNNILYHSGVEVSVKELRCPACGSEKLKTLGSKGARSFKCEGCEAIKAEDEIRLDEHKVHVIKGNIHPIMVSTHFTPEAKTLCAKLGIDFMYAGVLERKLSEWVTGETVDLNAIRRELQRTPVEEFKIGLAPKRGEAKKQLREWFYGVLKKVSLA